MSDEFEKEVKSLVHWSIGLGILIGAVIGILIGVLIGYFIFNNGSTGQYSSSLVPVSSSISVPCSVTGFKCRKLGEYYMCNILLNCGGENYTKTLILNDVSDLDYVTCRLVNGYVKCCMSSC